MSETKKDDIEFRVTLLTTDFRGDHSAEVEVPIECAGRNELVQDLINRLLSPDDGHARYDTIKISKVRARR